MDAHDHSPALRSESPDRKRESLIATTLRGDSIALPFLNYQDSQAADFPVRFYRALPIN
jgi:hypothetical protein